MTCGTRPTRRPRHDGCSRTAQAPASPSTAHRCCGCAWCVPPTGNTSSAFSCTTRSPTAGPTACCWTSSARCTARCAPAQNPTCDRCACSTPTPRRGSAAASPTPGSPSCRSTGSPACAACPRSSRCRSTGRARSVRPRRAAATRSPCQSAPCPACGRSPGRSGRRASWSCSPRWPRPCPAGRARPTWSSAVPRAGAPIATWTRSSGRWSTPSCCAWPRRGTPPAGSWSAGPAGWRSTRTPTPTCRSNASSSTCGHGAVPPTTRCSR